MKVHNIHIENYRKFETLDVAFNSQMNVLVGNNGTGKTSILDAVSVMLEDTFSIFQKKSHRINKSDVRCISKKIGSTIDRQPQFPVKIYGVKELAQDRPINCYLTFDTDLVNCGVFDSTDTLEFREKVKNGDENTILPIISYYRSGRFWIQNRKKTNYTIENRFQGYTDCLSAECNERQMLKWFEKMTYIQLQEGKPIPELQAVEKTVAKCYIESGAKVRNVHIIFDVRSNQLEITYRDSNGDYQRHPFRELSDGYRNTLSMIADIAYRMAVLNPQFLDKVTEKTPGIVLIDEIDLHLHPIWQKRILKTLKKVFPLVQFIVTTHSPSVISSARADELIIIDGDSCRTFDYEVYGKDANSVLTEIMGTPDCPDEVAEMFAELDRLMENEDFKAAEKKLAVLRSILGDNDSRVVSASVALNFQKDWEE